MERKTHIFQRLDTNGNGSGTVNAIGDYSGGSATPFYITPQAVGTQMVLSRIMIYIEDDNNQFTLANYGGATALTTGVWPRVVRGNGQTVSLSGSLRVKSNADWQAMCYDVQMTSFAAGNNYLNARWTFSRSGWPIVLNFGDQLQFYMQDSLTALIRHEFMVQGYIP
jgi:hypothetical protein